MKLWFNWHFEGVDHVPAEGPLIVAGNHISYLDPWTHAYFVIQAGRRPRFLAKAELFKIPFVGMVLRGAGQIRVDRGTGDQTPLLQAADALGRGEVVVIYPEGTVTKNPDFTPMQAKTGVVRLALATGVPVLPVGTWGSQRVWQKTGKGDIAFGRPVWAKAGEPIDLVAKAGGRIDLSERSEQEAALLRELTDDLMRELSLLVADLRGRYPKRWSR